MTFRRRRAYTLIELLTVIAITAILLTIIVLPIIDSFNLLRAGQGWSEAQERARILLDRISREIAKSAGLRDNSGVGGQIMVMVPPGPGSFDATPIPELLTYAKMDLYKAAEGEVQTDALGNPVYVDPVTGKIDPTLHAPKGQALLPATAGSTLVRYYIALRNPFAAAGSTNPANYNNPYDGLLMARNSQQDNLYVLYRAEIQPYVYNGTSFVGNGTYFALDANNNPILDDPSFMIPDGTAAKAARIQSWLNASVVQTEVSRYDMILPVYNKNTRAVVFDKVPASTPGNFDFAPRLVPLLQFRPTRISNEPGTQARTVRLGEESDNSGQSGADVIRTSFGQWSNPVVRSYPVPLVGGANPATNLYEVGRNGTRSDNTFGFSEYQIDPTLGLDDTASGVELFDFTAFNNVVNNPPAGLPYPFSAGVQAAVTRSGWIGNLASRQLFAPYQPDGSNGQLLASFSIDEVGLNALAGPARMNLPLGFSGTVASPKMSSGAGAVWAGPGYTINDAFNLSWNTYNGQGGHGDLRGNLQRFIDLRVTPNEDGTYGPLFPDGAINIAGANVVINGSQGSFARATIVPGSEVVKGPDQLPGPNYGNEIRYTRTTQAPGPNQYRINYVAQPQPLNPVTQVIDYTILGLSATDLAGFNPAVYDPTNFVSAAIQARYMPGYIELNSDPNAPLDTTNAKFSVYYRFEFTNPNDSFAVDYDSREVMSVLLTLHDYPQTTLPNPQTMTLKTTATVRNFLR
ncbi:MAG TPA: prepilin-type N-terminal cleavage/methylation domain-containing protein [Fimbriimonadaceae bacterium]|nr:prepilin-type N-terminal cleavage/methylation domain-containing protein [Fimbriimonadaceae bacterium]